MKTVFFLLFVTYESGFCENDERPDQSYITGGTDASIDEVPYQASVIHFGRIISCGATIIHEYWVLTAGHCIRYEDYLTVRTGTDKLRARGIRHDMDYAVIHPQYNVTNLDNDIALIKLKQPIIFNKNQTSIPIATPIDIPEEGQFMLISGFGRLKEHARQAATLQKGDVPIINQEICKIAHMKDPITDNNFCAGNGTIDACQGDSGGPGVINGKLYGVVSAGEYCPSSEYPGIYTRVHLYYDWIVEITGVDFELTQTNEFNNQIIDK